MESNEKIVNEFIFEYERVLKLLENKDAISIYELGKMKSFTRMYMESSSNYNQEFFYAMGNVESIIRKF